MKLSAIVSRASTKPLTPTVAGELSIIPSKLLSNCEWPASNKS